MTKQKKTIDERFDEKFERRGDDECWNWVAGLDKDGYGCFQAPTTSRAHRYAYERAYGPIPKGDGFHGTCICHRCDNPRCVNPRHLFAGTMADNMRDMKEKGRLKPGTENLTGRGAPKKLTAEIALAIRCSPLSQKKLGALYGVDRTLIYQIKKGKIWAHAK